jgi:hypothetical protein
MATKTFWRRGEARNVSPIPFTSVWYTMVESVYKVLVVGCQSCTRRGLAGLLPFQQRLLALCPCSAEPLNAEVVPGWLQQQMLGWHPCKSRWSEVVPSCFLDDGVGLWAKKYSELINGQ